MPDNTQEHNWEHRGLGVLPKETPRWEGLAKGMVSFLFGIVSAAFLFGGKSHDLNDLLAWKIEVIDEFKNIYTRMDRMEREGTSRSHWVDDAQSIGIAANEKRIAEIERKAEARTETVNVMQGKLERLEGELKDIKDRIPK